MTLHHTPDHALDDRSGELRALAKARNPLIAVHRGLSGGMVHENTPAAALAALASGADIVEFDVVRSTDGRFYVFHDGYEPMHLHHRTPLPELSSSEIEALHYHQHTYATDPARVATLEQMLTAHPEVIFNVDRSWWYWDTLLPVLDSFDISGRLVLKCPPEERWLAMLGAHPVRYPLIPMVETPDEVEFVLGYPGIDVVGVELLARGANSPFLADGYIDALHTRGVLVFANAINLENRVPLFAGFDDETSLGGHPDDGWGRLVDLGVDIIQTDWPAPLAHYLGRSLRFPVKM